MKTNYAIGTRADGTKLELNYNATLMKLWCDSNQLTKLNVPKNTTLTELRCDYNQLTKLDVSKNADLTKLWCYDNPNLTTITVRKGQKITIYKDDHTNIVYV